MPWQVAFDVQHFSVRGTEVAIYDYAHYNETILGNKSIVVCRRGVTGHPAHSNEIHQKFAKRFEIVEFNGKHEGLLEIFRNRGINVWYQLRGGNRNPDDTEIHWSFSGVNRIVHCVFLLDKPYGNVYLPISSSVYVSGQNTEMMQRLNHYIPHVVDCFCFTSPNEMEIQKTNRSNFRMKFQIPEDALVLGRHGGRETFDLPFVWEAIPEILQDQKIYMVLVHTDIPESMKNFKSTQLIVIESIVSKQDKLEFLDGCDVLLHARAAGETFGLAVAEFAARGKLVLTNTAMSSPFFDFHHQILQNRAFYYSNKTTLLSQIHILKSLPTHELQKRQNETRTAYLPFAPESVMNLFKKHFLLTWESNVPLDLLSMAHEPCWYLIHPTLQTFQHMRGWKYIPQPHQERTYIGRLCFMASSPQNTKQIQRKVSLDKKRSKVLMTCNFLSNEDLLKLWYRLFPVKFLERHQLITSFQDKPDFTLIVNRPPDSILLSTQNKPYDPCKTLVFRMEPETETHPYWNSFYDSKEQFLHFGDLSKFRNNNEWHLSASYQDFMSGSVNLRKSQEKKYIVSAIVSGAYSSRGHQLRINFLKYVEQRLSKQANAASWRLDIYGKENPFQFQNYLGPLPAHQKDKGLLSYCYHFNAENNALDNYYTEKIIDPILSETLCFYWGCKNIDQHIDSRAYIQLPLQTCFETSFRMMNDAITQNEYEHRLPHIQKEKQKILQWYNPGFRIESLISFYTSFPKFVINLKSRPDRWKQFVQRAHDVGLYSNMYFRHEAIDGRTVDERTMSKYFYNPFRQLRQGELGCALSHYESWKHCFSMNQPCYIFEDDVTFKANFIDKASTYIHWLQQELDPNFLIVFLGLTPDEKLCQDNNWTRNDLADLNPNLHESKLPNPFVALSDILRHANPKHLFGWHGGGLFGYVISPRGAKFLLDIVDTRGITWAVDMFILLCLRGYYHDIPLLGGPDFFAGQHTWILRHSIVESAVVPSEGQDSVGDSDVQKSMYIPFTTGTWRQEPFSNLPIYVINLEHRSDRYEKFMRHLLETKIVPDHTKVHRFDAVDGKTVSANEILKLCSPQSVRPLRQGEIGCALSHIRMWKMCLWLQKPCVIYEDDTVLRPNFVTRMDRIWSKLITIDPQFDMLYLGYTLDDRLPKSFGWAPEKITALQQDTSLNQDTIEPYSEFVKLATQERLFGWHGGGQFAYVISPKGAQFLLDTLEKQQGINWSLDFWILLAFRGFFDNNNNSNHTWIIKQPVAESAMYNQTSDFDTDIQTSPFVILPDRREALPQTTAGVKVVQNGA
jgi:GR25 family glycosyltransferase involved in LPS biosynthesis